MSQIFRTQASEDNVENTERQAFSIVILLKKQPQYNSLRSPSHLFLRVAYWSVKSIQDLSTRSME